jgi:hypothetical protein
MNWELAGVLVLLLAGWFWWDSIQKRELAVQAVRQVCQRAGVQLLDDSVSLGRIRLARDQNQRVTFSRDFNFEYSDTGDNRMPGRVYLLGNRILDIQLIQTSAPDAMMED